RTIRSRVALRKAGQVELFLETPNGLSADVTLTGAGRECQYYLRDAPINSEKDGQLFIRPYDESLSVAAMCVRDPDRSPVCGAGLLSSSPPTGRTRPVASCALTFCSPAVSASICFC